MRLATTSASTDTKVLKGGTWVTLQQRQRERRQGRLQRLGIELLGEQNFIPLHTRYADLVGQVIRCKPYPQRTFNVTRLRCAAELDAVESPVIEIGQQMNQIAHVLNSIEKRYKTEAGEASKTLKRKSLCMLDVLKERYSEHEHVFSLAKLSKSFRYRRAGLEPPKAAVYTRQAQSRAVSRKKTMKKLSVKEVKSVKGGSLFGSIIKVLTGASLLSDPVVATVATTTAAGGGVGSTTAHALLR